SRTMGRLLKSGHAGFRTARARPLLDRPRVNSAASVAPCRADPPSSGGADQGLAELLQGTAHLRLHRADRAVVQVGDLIVSQVAVLTQQEYFLLLQSQDQQRLAQAVQHFLLGG